MIQTNITGIYGSAVCYAKIIDPAAIEQIQLMCDQPFTQGSTIRIMPDVHAGTGCTIGTTMTVTDKIVPNIVGVDIGCGMYAVKLDQKDIDMNALDAAAHYIPSGMGVWEGRQEKFDLEGLTCFRNLKDTKRLERSLGTLGGGNHFIEVDRAQDGTNYLVIHSGSRNLGKQVANYHQDIAVQLHSGMEEYFAKRDALIAEYKAAGRRTEIQAALKAMEPMHTEPDMPADLCFLYGKYMDDYLADVVICQQFARRSRELMAKVLLERANLTAADAFHTVHNYISVDERILRKGSISARAGEKMLIPINMRDGSILAVGKGNPDWNFSAPHGAGRLMSRAQARATINMTDYQNTMAGIYTTSVLPETIDEAPMAYKSLADILDVITPTADVVDVMKPIYNFKASG